MTCNCTSSAQLAAWVDGALDPEATRDVACHLATCPDCHAAAALLSEETDALRQALGRDKAPAHLWTRISARLTTEPGRASGWDAWRPRIRMPRVGAALAALLVAGLLLIQHGPDVRPAPDLTLQALAVETAQDYETFRISQRGLDVFGDDPTATRHWLSARLNGALPEMADHVLGYRLIGGRLCWLMGQRLAALTYASDTVQVTVYVMAADPGDAADQLPETEGPSFHDQGPVRSMAWVENGLLIAIVSDLPDADRNRFAAALSRTLTPEIEI